MREATEVDEVAAISTDGITVEVLFDRTPFYAESGGQASDIGEVEWPGGAGKLVAVAKQASELFVHTLHLDSGRLALGDRVRLAIDAGATHPHPGQPLLGPPRSMRR